MSVTERLLLLGSAVLTSEGRYQYRLISQPEAVELLRARAAEIASFVGHESTAALLTELVGVPFAANRGSVTQRTGETAVVVRLAQRAPQASEYAHNELTARSLEWGLLKRLE